VAEVDKMVPEFSLSKYLKAFAPAGYEVTPNLTVIVNDINWYGNLSSILKTTPRESLHDYFVSRLIATWSGRLHNNFTTASRAFSNKLSGKDPNNVPIRWRTCVSEIDNHMGYILSAAFIEKAFTAADKTLGDRIVHDIKDFFTERFKQFDWMTPQVKEVAAKKGMTYALQLYNILTLDQL
jgi:endothelin-converting enzyme